FFTFSGGSIGVDAGKLVITGVISGSDPIKVGAGTLESGGINANTFTGGLRLKEGTFIANKAPGVAAIVGANQALIGDDDGVGAPGILVLAANDQILDTVPLQVGSTGQVNFAGFSDAITGLTLTTGPSGASTVSLGGGTLANLGGLTLQQL